MCDNLQEDLFFIVEHACKFLLHLRIDCSLSLRSITQQSVSFALRKKDNFAHIMSNDYLQLYNLNRRKLFEVVSNIKEVNYTIF